MTVVPGNAMKSRPGFNSLTVAVSVRGRVRHASNQRSLVALEVRLPSVSTASISVLSSRVRRTDVKLVDVIPPWPLRVKDVESPLASCGDARAIGSNRQGKSGRELIKGIDARKRGAEAAWKTHVHTTKPGQVESDR